MKINDEKTFGARIDELGKALEKIKSLNAEAKILKGLLELYAQENGINRFEAEHYRLKMSAQKPKLIREKTMSEEAVVELLEKDEDLRVYLRTGYDTEGLKAFAKATPEGEEILAAIGLTLTKPQRHAEVVPR